MAKGAILVRAIWDPEAEVFVATSGDVPGLVAEAASLAELQRKLDILIPELLELNSPEGTAGELHEVPVVVMSELVSKIRTRAYG